MRPGVYAIAEALGLSLPPLQRVALASALVRDITAPCGACGFPLPLSAVVSGGQHLGPRARSEAPARAVLSRRGPGGPAGAGFSTLTGE